MNLPCVHDTERDHCPTTGALFCALFRGDYDGYREKERDDNYHVVHAVL